MTNRPRRPKSSTRPGTTIDLEAGSVAPEATTGASYPVRDEADFVRDEADRASMEASDAAASSLPGPLHQPPIGGSGLPDDGGDALNRGAAEVPPASADVWPAGEPPAFGDADEAAGSGGARAAESAEAGIVPSPGPFPETGADERAASLGRGDDARGPEDTFADDEGLKGEPRRDFGEFEDDETVLAAAEPERVPGGDPLETSPYRSRETASRGAGFGALLGAGLLGAVLALGAFALLQYAGMMPAVAPVEDVGPTEQFAEAGEVQRISGDLEALGASVEQLRSAQAAGGTGEDGVSIADFTALTDRVTAAERAVQSGGASSGDAATAAASASETATSAGEVAGAAQAAADAAQAAADEAREAAAAADAIADEAAETAGNALRSAETAVQSADNALRTAEGAAGAAEAAETAAAEAGGRLADFETRIAAIEEANRTAAGALAAAGLKAAIDRGDPFMSELEVFAGTSGSEDAVAALRDLAPTGVPTAPALAAEWPEVEDGILAALRPADPGANVGEQVLAGFRSLVTVRPSGVPAEGTDGEAATLARMDGAVEAGNFEDWLAGWDTLGEAAKAASRDYADRVRARVEADAVVGRSVNAAVGATGTEG